MGWMVYREPFNFIVFGNSVYANYRTLPPLILSACVAPFSTSLSSSLVSFLGASLMKSVQAETFPN